MLDKLERKLGRFAIPHLTMILIGGQVLCFLGIQANPGLYNDLVLVPQLVNQGEFWRLLVFLFIPESDSILWFAIAMFVLHLMGTSLESRWGDFKYNLYILLGMLGTIAGSFAFSNEPATNFYIMTSIFLAFAYLFPDVEFLMFFVIPVKVKYLGMLTAALLAFSFLTAGGAQKVAISIAMANFTLFFGPQIYRQMRNKNKLAAQKIQAVKEANTPFHVCSVCNRTDLTNPQMHFRYQPGVDGPICFCEDHTPAPPGS